jgi:alpha-methylacyl-CoA racemase
MLLADLGAEVISATRARRADDVTPASPAGLGRRRRRVELDLRTPAGRDTALGIAHRVDAVIEGFRPGVAERLGVGPEDCCRDNAALVYGRTTGWGQNGPLADRPGHDINYLAVSGVLAHLGRAESLPAPPMSLIADGGAGMLLALGVLAAVVEAARSGSGQIVDTSMLEGATLLSTLMHEMNNEGAWVDERGANVNDSGAPFYDVYQTADGECVALGGVEDRLWEPLARLLGIADACTALDRWDRSAWSALRGMIQVAVARRTRDEWCALADEAGVCLSPVLSMSEAVVHPHNEARGVFERVPGGIFPAPSPRFSRTPIAALPQEDFEQDETADVLAELGIAAPPP